MTQRYEQLAGDVADLLSIGADATPEKLAAVSGTYAVATAEINERLRKAASLLRRGLRDEAIQECEREPKLLDAFELLDIHDEERWYAMHRQHAVLLPPPLLLQEASELNNAYALHAPLNDLLRKHRLLALGHAPLQHRIQVLRQIAQKDPNSEVWHADIKEFETAHIAEIKSALSRLGQSQNLASVQELHRELNSNVWEVPVPDQVRNDVSRILHRCEVEEAREKLTQCSAELREAFAEFDVQRGFELESVWNEHVATASLSSGHPLLVEAQPALEWLNEQRRHHEHESHCEDLLRDLESMLDDEDATRSDLDATFGRLSTVGAELPPVLVRRYHNRVAAIQTREKRSQTAKIVAVAGTLVILAGAVFVGLRSYQFASRVRQIADELERHRSNRQWSEGVTLIEVTQDTDDAVFSSAKFQVTKTRFEEGLQNDEVRAREFSKLVDSIRAFGVTTEDWSEIQTLKKLAITAEEKQLCSQLDAEQKEHDAKKVASAKAAFNPLIQKIDQEFRQATQPTVEQLVSFLDRIKQARKDYPYAVRGRLSASRTPEVDENLESSIDKKVKQLRRHARASQIIDDTQANLGRSIDTHADNLKTLRDELKDSEMGRQLATTLGEKEGWLIVDRLNSIAGPFYGMAHLITVSEANDALAKLQELKTKSGNLPAQFTPFEKYLTTIVDRPRLIVIDDLVPEPLREPTAPHADVMQKLVADYETIATQPDKWDATFLSVLDTIHGSSLDATLKLKLYRVAIDKSIEGSYAYEIGFGPIQQQLQSDEVAQILRQDSDELAEAFSLRLPHKRARQKVASVIRALGQIPKETVWVGWLCPTEFAQPTRPGIEPLIAESTPDGELTVIVKDAHGNFVHKTLGTVKSGEPQVTDEALLQAGRPLYWKK